MKYTDLGDKGPEFKIQQDVKEGKLNENASKLLRAEDRNGVITVIVQAPDGTKRSLADENPRYINQWLMKYGLTLPRSIMSKFVENDLKEFAPDNSGGDGGEEDVLLKFARMWYNGDEATQQQVEKALARQGWEIGELESEEGGAFVVRSGDEDGDSYIGFAINDLTEGWKDKLAAAALAGTMALGAAGAQARVSPGDDPSINRLSGKPVATQVAPAASQAVQPGASLPAKNLQAVDSIDGNKASGYTITQDGKSFDVKVVPKGSPTPRGAKMMKVTQAQLGERGIGNYVVYLLNNGTAYLYMGDVSEGRNDVDLEPALSALKKEFDKFANSDRANRDVADSDIDNADVTDDMGQDREKDLDEASLAQMRDFFNQADSDSVKVDRNYDAPSKKQNPLGIPPEIQALVNKMYHAGKITPQEFEILRKFQQQTKINVGIREADKNPYAIGMAQAMKSTGDKPPLKKSTINKAHEIARAIKKGE
jgi:hypothetical protein